MLQIYVLQQQFEHKCMSIQAVFASFGGNINDIDQSAAQ